MSIADTQPPVEPPQTAEQDGETRTRKRSRRWLTGLGFGLGVGALFCCGGVGVFAIFLTEFFARGLTTDAKIVTQRASSIADITLPADFKPVVSYEARIPLRERPVMTWAIFEANPEHTQFESYVLLGQFYAEVKEGSRDILMEEIQRSILDHDQLYEHVELNKKSVTRKRTIHGKKATFVIQEGEGSVSDEKYWVVLGEFQGKRGAAVMMIRANVKLCDRAAIDRMVDSIQ